MGDNINVNDFKEAKTVNKKLELFKKTLENKRITVIGIGVSNIPLIKFLCENKAEVTACDKRKKEDLTDEMKALSGFDVTYKLGGDYLKDLSGEIIFKTPGMRFDVPELISAKENGSLITSEMEVFFELCPCKIIAVTGSDGKTTTTTLISEMLKKQGFTVHLGGNIGKPLIGEIELICETDVAVLELSSFQLHTMKQSANVSVITNLSPNHLDYHKGIEEYVDAKKNIYLYQGKDDILVLNHDNERTNKLSSEANGKLRMFSRKEKMENGVFVDDGKILINGKVVLNISDIRLPGMHNVENYMAAIAAVYDMVDEETIVSVAKSFAGVEHRIEFVREVGGVLFYNDSIASSPTRAIAGLHAFDKKLIIIAGGYDKKIPFDDYGYELKDHAKKLFLIGKTKDLIKAAAEKAGMTDIVICDTLEDAVKKAYVSSEKGDIVMLSPACASFDMFKNFMVRGELFKEYVNALEE